jgi:hypothetical protein
VTAFKRLKIRAREFGDSKEKKEKKEKRIILVLEEDKRIINYNC